MLFAACFCNIYTLYPSLISMSAIISGKCGVFGWHRFYGIKTTL